MEVSSYRPISLLPVVSKLVERHIQQQLLRHMEKNNLFHPNGHAYRPCLSTNTAMMQLLDSIYCSTDDNKMTSLMALDMSSAFDCVNHAILLEKLEMYRCSKETLKMDASISELQISSCSNWQALFHKSIHKQRGAPGLYSGPPAVFDLYK